MATLHDIQSRLDTDLPKLKDRNYVEATLWPDIELMLTQVTDFDGVYPGDMGKLIYLWLKDHTLHGAPAAINLNRLKEALKTGTVKVSEPDQVRKWIYW